MTHWGWYWKIKKNHTPRPLCSHFMKIDSFSMFKFKQAAALCLNKVALEIPEYKLKATLLLDKLNVELDLGHYSIDIERQACNFGGVRYFFHCPKCKKRMRILYCVQGVFVCRKCINAGYPSQRRLASRRNMIQSDKIEKYFKLMGGDDCTKPKGMHWATFRRLQQKHTEYILKSEEAMCKELLSWYPGRKNEILRLI